MANSLTKLAKYSSNALVLEASIIGQRARAEKLSDEIDSIYLISQASIYLTDSAEKFSQVFKNPSYSKEDFIAGANALKSSVAKFRELEAKENLPISLKQQFSKYSPVIDTLDTSIDYLPKALGFEGERKYLLLFLNNMELRPGGGFIGSYATVVMNQAKVKDFKIYDVYDADGQLQEHLEPPFPIRRYLPSAHFYLRDSDFYLNFSDNALSAQNFLKIEKREKFDGVIAIDVSFTKAILEIIGPINVPNYNETVTSENFFDLADKYSRNSFFPGSTQKKDFLGAVFRAIQDNLKTKSVSYLDLAQVVSAGISEKHIQLYFNDAALQNTALVSGMSPGVLDSRKNNKDTINDYAGIVEANLGVNKVNKDIARTITKSVILNEEGSVSSTISIAFKNNSKSDNYKNYLRFVVPLDSKLDDIKINGVSQDTVDAISDPGIYEAKNFKPPTGLEVLTRNESGKTTFGFLVTVTKGNIKTFSLTYTLPSNVAIEKAVNYSLKFYKQPGTEDYPFGLEILFPDSLTYINSSEHLELFSGKISYESQVGKDFDLNLKLAPK
jgi:hypothetical protein